MNDALGHPQSVLVLGGGSDIAKATVQALVHRRCRSVVLAGRRPEVLDRVAADLRREGGGDGAERAVSVETMAFDALDREHHRAAIARAFQRPGGIDLVIVAFAILGDQESDQEDPESAARVIEVNFSGAVSSILAVVQEFRAQGRGTLVVLSSVAGMRVRRANYIYGSSKAGLDGFCQGLGDELTGTGIRLLTVRPGFVATKMTEGVKRAPLATTSGAVAEAILRGLESGATVVWVPPALRYVMGILRLVPRAIFRRLPG